MFVKRRLCLAAPAALSLATVLEGCKSVTSGPVNPDAPPFNAVVDAAFTGSAGAFAEGLPHFRTLQQGLDAAPVDTMTPWRIALRPGRYREKLEVTKPNIHLVGDSRARCVITFDAYSGQTRPSGVGTWTTFGCATLIVRAAGFAVSNMTIENSYDYLANDAKPPTDPTYTNDPQAVALMLAAGSDQATISNVTISGYQDTLFVDAGRSYFRDCLISGNVDFIFGAGQTVFEACDVVSRPRRKPNVFPHGYVTAPSTQIRERFGLVFLRCKLLRESTLVHPNSTALGRPWHPAATFPDGRYADPNAIGSSVFIECFMDDHIAQDGWWSMTGLQKTGPTRTLFLPEDSRFFEFRSSGPGASNGGGKRRRLGAVEAGEYTMANVLKGWQPARGQAL